MSRSDTSERATSGLLRGNSDGRGALGGYCNRCFSLKSFDHKMSRDQGLGLADSLALNREAFDLVSDGCLVLDV